MLSLQKGWQCCDPPASDFQKKTGCNLTLALGCWGAIPVSLWMCLGSSGVALGTDGGFYSESWTKLSSYLVAILGNMLPFFLAMCDALPVSSIQRPSGLSFLRLLGVFLKKIVMKRSYTLTFRWQCLLAVRAALTSSQALACSAVWSRSDAIRLNFGLPCALPWQQTDVTRSRTWLQCTIMQRHNQICGGESWLMHISKANKGNAGYSWPAKVPQCENSPLRGGADSVSKTGTIVLMSFSSPWRSRWLAGLLYL